MSKNEKNTMFGKKRSKLSVLPVVFSGLLAAGTLAGTGVSVWHVSKNYQESSEFKKSYNARLNVNPVAFEKTKTDRTTAEANLKESASRLSAWLKFNGSESYDVSYELTDPDSSTGSFEKSGWLSANFTVGKVNKVHVKSENEEKIDNDPYLSYFDAKGFNTNNRTLVYRWYNPSDTGRDGPYYTILDFNEVFDMPTNLKAKDNNTKTLIDKDGKSGVLLKIKDSSKLNAIYSDMKEAVKADKDDPKPSNKKLIQIQKPELFIINNIEQMFNEINYHLLSYGASLNQDQSFDLQYYKNIYDNSDYQKFAKTIDAHTQNHEDRSTHTYKLGAGLKHDAESASDVIENGEALAFLDYSKYGQVEHPFLNKYVEKIYKYESNDFQKFFPDKITDTYTNGEPSKEGATVNLQYAWLPTNSTNEADTFLSSTVDKNLKCKIVNIDVNSGELPAKTLVNSFKTAFASREVPPKFVDTIFGNNVVGVLSLGFLLFLIALLIILAVLYRTTGVMSLICMMFMLSMTGLISTIGATGITMSLLFGLFVMSLVGFIAAMAICGRVKRRICSNEDTSVAVIKGLKKSLWPIVDISFIALMFGICFTYIAPMNLNSLGVSLIVGGFATFICMYLLNGLLMLLFFNNGLTMNKFIFLGRPNNKANEALAQSNSYVPASMDATKLEFSFYDRLSATKFSLINWKTVIVLGSLALVMLIGIIIFSIMGLANNTLFHSSMCVVITCNDKTVVDVAALLPSTFKYTTMNHFGNFWYFYCDVPSADVMQSIRELVAGWNNSTVNFGNIIGNTNKDILSYAMISMAVAASVCAVFTGIRSNWSAFVPMLAGSILVPLLILGIASIAQLKFDQNVVLAFALAVVVNTLIANTIIASINDTWFRKESYNKEEIKFIVTAAAKNSLNYIIFIAVAYVLFIVFFGICSPSGLGSLVWVMVIGVICTSLATPITVSYLLYHFLVIRSKALTKRANRLANKVYVNMDEVDEQSIEGINKFTKPRAYSKKPVGENK